MNQSLRSIKQQMRTRGDATSEDRSRLEEARARYEKSLMNGTQLSEVLGVEMETMKEEQVISITNSVCRNFRVLIFYKDAGCVTKVNNELHFKESFQ